MNLLVLPDLNPTDDLVACVPPDDHGVSDRSVVDAVRRADPIAPKCGSSDVDHGAIALLDVLPVPGKIVGVTDDSTHTLRAGNTRDTGTVPALVAGDDCLEVHALGLRLPNGRRLLTDVSFSARPGSLTAIIGPSGAGKSTLAKLVGGALSPTAGAVCFDGHDLHAEYASLRHRIGLVPQDDVVHHQLTVDAALRFAAELRLPHATADERAAAVRRVLEELELTGHARTRVDKLSGGQRKRASVAMELLTGPALLILDEPTTGLDPALDRQVMSMLRRLADAGRVVLVVTHCLTHLDLCDQVLFLAPGGRTAYRGPAQRDRRSAGQHRLGRPVRQRRRRPRRGSPRVCDPLPRRGTPGQADPAASHVVVAAGAVPAAAPGVHRGTPPTAAPPGRPGPFPVPGGAAVHPGHARAFGARRCGAGCR